ncbi:MAG: polyphosphate polymerase domain-containing protein [Verrucomicrobia bacterium]|nr:polyphosphate polymerase domain-containing protein [Verrucomicrobiota bacterium]
MAEEHQSRLQAQRFELKYIIEEQAALGIRDYLRCYLELDEYGATLPNLSYPVHSLYLDSPNLKLYQDTINGDKNRFKLRLRFYENRPSAPVYCEIKRRMNNTISKERAALVRDGVQDVLAGYLPEPGRLVNPNPKQMVAIQHFCQLISDLRARPRTHVAYLREAWMSRHDNSVRVTLDRAVRTETSPGTTLRTKMTSPVLVFGDKVVLELKFTGRFPDWFKELVRIFGLVQCGAAKYADGVTRMGTQAVAHAFALDGYYSSAQARLDRIDHGPSFRQAVAISKDPQM